MSVHFAPGTACLPCKDIGHLCDARDYDDNRRPACYHCIDGVKCPEARKVAARRNLFPNAGKRVSTAKPKPVTFQRRGTMLPNKAEATKAIAVHEELPELKGPKITTLVVAQCSGEYEEVAVADIPNHVASPSHYDELVTRILALPAGRALRRKYASAKEAHSKAKNIRRRFVTRKAKVRVKHSGESLYFRHEGNPE